MGYRISWIARSGESTTELLELSERSASGERHEFPDIGWYVLELHSISSSSWCVLIADGSENYADLKPSQAQRLSESGSQVIFFWCSETVMATDLVCFENGHEAWSISYDGSDGTGIPEVKGEAPGFVNELLANFGSQQGKDSRADYMFDLTIETAHRIVGFRHDTDVHSDEDEPFQVLEKTMDRGSSKPWWRFWS